MEPGCGWTCRTRWEVLLCTGVGRWHCYNCQWKITNTISELRQETLSTVQQWCYRTQLSIDPQMLIVSLTRKRDLRGLKEPTLSGHTQQLTTKVIYLGLILDERLTWKAELKDEMNKTHGALWTCKGTFGKTWDLIHRVVHWIYTMVFRSIFTSSCMVWWLSIWYDVSRMELSKVRWLACLAVTWVMKTVSMAAMEVLLGLLQFRWLLRQRPRQGSAD